MYYMLKRRASLTSLEWFLPAYTPPTAPRHLTDCNLPASYTTLLSAYLQLRCPLYTAACTPACHAIAARHATAARLLREPLPFSMHNYALCSSFSVPAAHCCLLWVLLLQHPHALPCLLPTVPHPRSVVNARDTVSTEERPPCASSYRAFGHGCVADLNL